MSAKCGYEFCCNGATWHIDGNYGLCDQHHNLGYTYAGRPHYNKPEHCYKCVKEDRICAYCKGIKPEGKWGSCGKVECEQALHRD